MNPKYDTAIILSHQIDSQGRHSAESLARMDKGVNFYLKNICKTLIMTGGYINKDFHLPFSEAMAKYAIKKGVKEKDIFKEEKSLETVAQAIFTKLEIVMPHNWKKIIIISSDYHIRRVKKIFDFVYGTHFELRYESINSGLKENPQIKKKEQDSINAFLNTFNGITQSNNKEILMRLYNSHPLYNKIPETERRLFYN